MNLRYTVSKEKGGKWYAHMTGFPGIPVMIDGSPTFGTKKDALHNAACAMGLTYKDYMDLRRKEGAKENAVYDPQPGKVE